MGDGAIGRKLNSTVNIRSSSLALKWAPVVDRAKDGGKDGDKQMSCREAKGWEMI